MFRPTYLDVSPSLTTTHRNVPFIVWGGVVADVLMVGGGGAAGQSYVVGGAGGGGYLEGSMTLVQSKKYQVVVAAGGARSTSGYTGTTGSTSTFNDVTALGGSGGGYMGTGSGQPTMTGGSGGGRAGFTDNSQCGHVMNYGQSSSGSMTGYANTGSTFCCSGATGCVGCYSSGGGGGGGGAQGATGSNGGSGIVIIRYSGSPRATGGTITSSGGYTIHTFTSTGFFQGK